MTLELLGNPLAAGTDATLQITSERRMETTLQWRDGTGRLCGSQPILLAAGENQWTLDTKNLPAGFYFVSLHTVSGALTTTLVIR